MTIEADHPWPNAAIVQRRRNFSAPGYVTLAEAGFDGPWVSPYQISARAPAGPVLLAYHWIDAEGAAAYREELMGSGFLASMVFNRVLDAALAARGRARADVYVTQVFHLLPPTNRSAHIPAALIKQSFEAITRHELPGRKVVALGQAAAEVCKALDRPPACVLHPSARGLSVDAKARQLAEALASVGF